MIIRIFLVLLALNLVAFVVRAEANERPAIAAELYPEELTELQDRMSGDFDSTEEEDALTTLGSRLLSWRFSRNRDDGRHYAYEAARPDHGIALIENGACLNLRWNF
ncbi:MAG: hypothetical protein R3280_02725 [Marinobacter sp.]|uniref:hypothetical protein n=1 Tax=Marinobacter sp. TaxID=50741 RepID=UPI00299EA341|nr:hypothetical protein [Marinobacter sp.]MDX1633528.1 hypothetical protein [Marinobacter sp.]